MEVNIVDWVEEFYDKQVKWTGSYTGPVTKFHRDKVQAIEKTLGLTPKKILELGSGGGQFAVAAASRGHEVIAVELNANLVKHGEKLAKSEGTSNLKFIEGNFYEVFLEDNFDVICYWDGFGIGEDSDQRRLLKRNSNWLKPNGKVFMDIYTPWYWAKVSGKKMSFPSFKRCYNFDPYGCRMLDKWWPEDDESQRVTQSLRCYSPADLEMLIEDTGLMIEMIQPGGAMDYENMLFLDEVPLEDAMSYLVILGKAKK